MKKFSVIFLIISFGSIFCNDSSPNKGDSQPVITNPVITDGFFWYSVVKIENRNIDEFIKNVPTFEYPLKIKLKYMNKMFTGTVKFEKLGEMPIDSISADILKFWTTTKGKLGYVEEIGFSFSTFSKDSLNGLYYPIGQLVDMPYHPFQAVRVDN
jgi:hypothetical protein